MHLEQRSAKPLLEMRQVVFEFAVVPAAVRLVRDIAVDYVLASKMPEKHLQDLCGAPVFSGSTSEGHLGMSCQFVDRLKEQVELLVDEDTLQQGIGAPNRLANFIGERPSLDFTARGNQRWKEWLPWSEVLSCLFQAAQDELRDQASEVSGRGQLFLHVPLNPIEKIVYKHLYDMRSARSRNRGHKFGDEGWMSLMRELDSASISLDDNLEPNGLRVLIEICNLTPMSCWVDAYRSKRAIRMFPEKEGLAKARSYRMNREVKKALTNICRGATEKLKKAFGKAVSPDHFGDRLR